MIQLHKLDQISKIKNQRNIILIIFIKINLDYKEKEPVLWTGSLL